MSSQRPAPPAPPDSASGHEGQRLDSWKEIAAYLRKDERTAQRWAKEQRLPVHRVPGGKRGGVFAYAHEIEGWLKGQVGDNRELTVDRPQPGLASRQSTDGSPQLAGNVQRAGGDGSLPVADGQPDQNKAAASLPHSISPPRALRAKWLVAAGAVGVALAFSAYLITTALAAKPAPTRVVYGTSRMVVYGESNEPLWSFEFPGSLAPLDHNVPPETHQTRILDFDGDGEREILSFVSWLAPSNPNALQESAFVRFSAHGELLQRYTPSDTITFNGRTFAPPWTIRAFLVDTTQAKPSVWLAFSHHTWWPAVLVHLDANGREVGRFTHAGWIQSLASMQTREGQFILAGGINNEKGTAMLAVLDATNPTGAGPPDAASPYECDNCSAAAPHRYFLFPRSEAARAIDLPYNQVVRIAATAHGFHAYTEETPDRNNLIHEFTADFRFVGVAMSDYYAAYHDGLYGEGKLDHAAVNCPEIRNPPRPLEWRDGTWHELTPLSAAQPSR